MLKIEAGVNDCQSVFEGNWEGERVQRSGLHIPATTQAPRVQALLGDGANPWGPAALCQRDP